MITFWYLLICMAVGLLFYLLLVSFKVTETSAVASQLFTSTKQRKKEELEKTSKEYEKLFIFIAPEKLNAQRQACILGLGILGLVLGVSTGPLAGIVLLMLFGMLGYFLPTLFLKRAIAKRMDLFQSQILDMLDTVSNALKAGLSFVQALETAAAQLPDPIGQELQLVMKEHSLGANLDEALIAMSNRVKSDSFNLVVSAVTVTRQLGGNLPEIFATISSTIRDRESMEGKVKALTSQGKMQGLVMGAIPFALMGLVYLLDPKTIMPLFTTVPGWCLLAGVVILDGLGYLVIRWIVAIDI